MLRLKNGINVKHNSAAGHAFLRPVPDSNMTFCTSSDDTIFFKANPAHWIIVDNFRLLKYYQHKLFHVGLLERTMTGGNSAVRVLDSTECSIRSSPSALFEVRLELERNLKVAWLSARFRVIGLCDAILSLCRMDVFENLAGACGNPGEK